MWEIIGGLALLAALAWFASWYQTWSDDEEDVQLNEMDLELDDRIKELFSEDFDDDPYGEGELQDHNSYRATLVNRGTTTNKE